MRSGATTRRPKSRRMIALFLLRDREISWSTEGGAITKAEPCAAEERPSQGRRWSHVRSVVRSVLALSLVPGACTVTPDAEGLATHFRKDSAGTELVIHESVKAVPVLTIEKSHLDLGGLRDNPNDEFDSRNPFLAAARLSTGALVVNDYAQLKFFSSAGRFVRAAGRAGSGPGEFHQIREICIIHGDTILTIDGSNGQLTFWDSSGRHISTYTRPGFVPQRGCLRDGTVVVRAPPTRTQGTLGITAEYTIRRRDGSVVQSLGELPAPLYIPPVFWEPTVLVANNLVYVAPATSFEVSIRDTLGHNLRVIRVLDPPRSITDDDWRRMFASTVPGSDLDPTKAKEVARLMSRPRPSQLPAYHAVSLDPKGRIWVGDYEDRRLWTVFAPNGEVIGRVTLPIGTELAGIEDDEIVVRHRDSDGAIRLTFHRLRTLPS